MADKNWFRRTTWTDADQWAFFARLERSRTLYNKAQYLRIQAWYLYEVGTPEMIQASLALVDKLLTEYPNSGQESLGSTLRAQCLLALGRRDEAIEACQASMAAQRTGECFRDDSYLDFGDLVLRAKRVDLYDAVISSFEEFAGGKVFPVQRFRYACILAFIAARKGNKEQAERYAKEALAEVSVQHSGFRYHADLGLVNAVSPELRSQLEAMANVDPGRSEQLTGSD